MEIDNEKYNNFIQSREREDEIYQYYRGKGNSVHWINSGKFGLFIKFQKEIFKLFRQVNISSPTAMRVFLYIIECCLGYDDDPRSEIIFNVKKIIKECNIKNRKSLYDSVNLLQAKNMIFILKKEEIKFLKLNSSILNWNVEEDRKNKVYQKEVDRLSNL